MANRRLANILFWIGLTGSLLAFFEQALDNNSPIWSSVLGFPFLHHGYYFLILIAVAWLIRPKLITHPTPNN